MALYFLPRIYRRELYHVISTFFNKGFSDKVLNIDDDVIEQFTKQLLSNRRTESRTTNILKRIKKCATLKSQNEKPFRLREIIINMESIDKQFLNLIDENNIEDLKYLITECKKSQLCPSTSTVLLMLQNFSYDGDLLILNEIISMVKSGNFQEYLQFDMYIATAMWVNGNVIPALGIFQKVYEDNVHLRRTITHTIHYLLLDVSRSSEAILVNITKFIEHLYQDYQDVFLLVYLWEYCFLSEWYVDQCLALDLLEKYSGLREVIGQQVSNVVVILLRTHRTEEVYRLLEVLLKYEMKPQYTMVVVSLFQYKLRTNDVTSATEIIRWAVDNDIQLPSSVYERFIMLLLKKPYAPSKPPAPPKDNKLKFNFKF